MTNILEISDGTTTINLLSSSFGLCLNSWNPQIAQPKRGGVFQSSSLSQGRKLVDRKFENIQDNFNFDIKGSGQPETITYIANLINLLEQAVEYWTMPNGFANKVWLKAKADCEENSRYALIVNYSWPELGFLYGDSFFKAGEIASMINVDLGLEHGLWQATVPGTSECAEASSVQVWEYDAEWVVNDATITAFSLFQAANGYLYAGGNINTYRSVDNGASWTNVDAGLTDRGESIIQASANGYIFVANGFNIRRSVDNGATWTSVLTIAGALLNSLLELASGRLLCSASNGKIYKSDDDGASWSLLSTISSYTIEDLVQLSNGDIFAAVNATQAYLSKSSDDGATWITAFSFPTPGGTSNVYTLLLANDNSIYAGGGVGNTGVGIFKSTDNGSTWFPSFFRDTLEFGPLDMIEDSDNNLWAIGLGDGGATDGRIYKSIDAGVTWFDQAGSFLADLGLSMLQAANGDLYAGDSDNLNKRAAPNTADMGRTATCNNEVMIANCQPIGNLTHIKIDDGGVFSDIFPATLPQDLLPAIPVVNDAIYFGQDTDIEQTGPFDNLIFDLGTVLTFTISYTISWEYWNGAWVALTVHDETDGSGVFTSGDVKGVYWEQPSDWATTTIDGITAYWVRARLSALSGVITPPTQQNRDIYTVVLPYVNIASTAILGDIPAILKQQLQNQSDQDGRGGSAPNLWDNRIITGLRKYNRGEDFQAYINISDEQNPVGISVTDTGTNTAFAADTTTPTGRVATYNPAGVEAMATQVAISLGPSIARDFYGKFHAFLRVQRTAGAITDFDIQLQFVSGSGGIQSTTQSKQVQTTTQFELLDFGQVEIPVGGSFKPTDLGDTTEIRIQASAASGTPNLNMYDLILMPVDEWSVDSIDFANTSDSIIGLDDGIQKYLDVDSITNPKVDIQSLAKLAGNNQITSVYNTISPGKAILHENTQQRLWFLAAQTDQTGTPTAWIAPPYIAHSIQLFKAERYLTLSKGITQ